MERVTVYDYEGLRMKEMKTLPLSQCPVSFDEAIGAAVGDRFQCTSDYTNMTLEGSYLSPEFSYLRIRLYPCNSERDAVQCASDDEIEEYFRGQDLNYFYTNTYYDQTEYP